MDRREFFGAAAAALAAVSIAGSLPAVEGVTAVRITAETAYFSGCCTFPRLACVVMLDGVEYDATFDEKPANCGSTFQRECCR